MVQIITDTTACVPPQVAQRYHIPVIPQIIHLGTQSYLEGVDIDNATFMRHLREGPEQPRTAAPPPEFFVKEFERLVPLGEPILCIHPSAEISGTVRSATLAREQFPTADIRVIDTRSVASPLGSMVALAAQWAEAGDDADSIETRVRDMALRARIYFLVATLEYLARGGRIGGAAALLGSVLQIKPILSLADGRIDKLEQERTHKRALARLKQLVVEQCPRDGTGYLTAMHSGVPEQGEALARDLQALLGVDALPVLDVPPAIVTHGGPGILGVGFFVSAAA